MRLGDLLDGGEVVVGRDQHGLGQHVGHAAAVDAADRVVAGRLGEDADRRIVVVAVVGTLELQHLVLAGEGPGHAQGIEGRLGAGGGEGDFLGAGDGVDQDAGQLDGGVVQGAEEVQALVGLFLHGDQHRRMGVSQDVGAGAADVVDVPVALDRFEPAADAALDHEAQVLGQGNSRQARRRAGCARLPGNAPPGSSRNGRCRGRSGWTWSDPQWGWAWIWRGLHGHPASFETRRCAPLLRMRRIGRLAHRQRRTRMQGI